MQVVRFWHGKGISYGMLEETEVRELEGSLLKGFTLTNKVYDFDMVQFLAPCEPSKIICVGLNFKDHAEEMEMDYPEEPVIFFKPPSSIIGSGASIIYPKWSKRVEYEAELAVVMGEITRFVEEEEALEKVFGYTCANDVTARDLQLPNGQWSISKAFDTFCPIGPYITTNIAVDNLKISLYQNGVIKQESSTSLMFFSIPYLISYLSKVMTLFPGDLILTGTPSGVGSFNIGDQIEINIENIGTLKNTIEK